MRITVKTDGLIGEFNAGVEFGRVRNVGTDILHTGNRKELSCSLRRVTHYTFMTAL